MRTVIVLIGVALLATGCLTAAGRKLGTGLREGLANVDTDVSNTLEGVVEEALAKELAGKLGRQLGEGLTDGAINEQKRAELEATIDALIAVAAYRSGKGLREEVGPEFRRIVRRDIVETFADGLRGDLGDSLEETADRVVDRTMASLQENLADPSLRYTLGEILREGVRDAVEGGNPASPGIGITLEETLTSNVLDPFSSSVGGVADRVAYQVSESARRTENLLKTIISGLIVVLGALAILYVIRDRQARRARENEQQVQRTVGAAFEVLDEETRKQVVERLGTYEHLFAEDAPTGASEGRRAGRRRRAPDTDRLDRSSAYTRPRRDRGERGATGDPGASSRGGEDLYTRGGPRRDDDPNEDA